MRPVEVKITRFIAGRYCTVLLIVLGFLACMASYGSRAAAPMSGNPGIAVTSPLSEGLTPLVQFLIGLGLTAAAVWLMEFINRSFNLLRTTQTLFLGMYVVLQSATPLLIGASADALLMNVVVLASLAVIYTTYLQPSLTRRVFLIFCVMAALMLTNYVYLLYILLFLLSFGQMRCMGPRMVIAALLGIITPAWIVLGLGFIAPADIHLPTLPGVIGELPRTRLVMLIITVGVTVITSFLLCAVNMVKIYAYNAKDRALNGLLMMLTLATALFILIDFRNSPTYLPLLNSLAAFQTGLFFRVNASRRGYVPVVCLFVIFAAIYFCNLWL